MEPFCLIQDYSPIYTSHIVKDWFCEHPDIMLQMPHSPRPPDLNPIENVWAVMSKYMREDHTRNYVAVAIYALQAYDVRKAVP